MTSFIDTAGSVALAALLVWYVGGPLLRLAATSCLVCAAGLLALGDVAAAAGVASCGLVCRVAGQLLYRARHRPRTSPRAAPLGRRPADRGRRGSARRPA